MTVMAAGSSASPETQQCRRFEVSALPLHAKMQMRTSGAPTRSALRDGHTLIDGSALFDQKFREVHVQREDGLPMVDHDEAAFDVKVPGHHHPTQAGSPNF